MKTQKGFIPRNSRKGLTPIILIENHPMISLPSQSNQKTWIPLPTWIYKKNPVSLTKSTHIQKQERNLSTYETGEIYRRYKSTQTTLNVKK